jgi:hypothetical protein
MNRLATYYFLIIFVLCNGFVTAQDATVSTIINNVNLDSLTLRVKQLSGEIPVSINGQNHTIQSRQRQTAGNELAYQFIKQEIQRYGYQVDSFRFSPTGKNLYAIIKGTLFPQQQLILGAHYDNLPLSAIAPGADDNASGCAAILEVCRLLRDYSSPYTLVFAFWDEEEDGMVGSTAHAKRMSFNNEQLIAYINLDMIAWDGNNDSIVDINLKNIQHSAFIKEKYLLANQAYNIGLHLNILNPGNYHSDQKPFWDYGFSALAINEHYLYDFNPHYHKVTDKIDHFNVDYFLRVSKLALAGFLELSQDIDHDYGFFDNDLAVLIFPNPVKNELFIRLKDKEEIIEHIQLIDYNGRILQEIIPESKPIVQLETTTWKKGSYFIAIQTNNQRYLRKLIIEN